VRVLGKLFRDLFLTRLLALSDAGRLGFFGSIAAREHDVIKVTPSIVRSTTHPRESGAGLAFLL